jgi:NADPH2:quinone reductase
MGSQQANELTSSGAAADPAGEQLETMHAIRQYEFGPPEVLRYEEVRTPTPTSGQVRIAVEASGVHLIDTAIRNGHGPDYYARPRLPMIPGREVAGAVDAVGAGVDKSWAGRRVVAHLGLASGGYAEHALAPSDALHELPGGLDADVAVAMIGTGRTAMAILETADLGAEDVVLATGAAGGLGSLFIQAARNAGATVVGVAGGPGKLARMRELGATVAVDHLRPGWTERVRDALGGREVSVVLDGVGGALGRQALELLRPGGRMLVFGWSSGGPTELTTMDVFARSVTVTTGLGPGFGSPERRRELETRALAEAGAGRLVPPVSRFPLADAAAAHKAVEGRATIGKTVLIP